MTHLHERCYVRMLCTPVVFSITANSRPYEQWLQFDFGAGEITVVAVRSRCRVKDDLAQCVTFYKIQYWQDDAWGHFFNQDNSIKVSTKDELNLGSRIKTLKIIPSGHPPPTYWQNPTKQTPPSKPFRTKNSGANPPLAKTPRDKKETSKLSANSVIPPQTFSHGYFYTTSLVHFLSGYFKPPPPPLCHFPQIWSLNYLPTLRSFISPFTYSQSFILRLFLTQSYHFSKSFSPKASCHL